MVVFPYMDNKDIMPGCIRYQIAESLVRCLPSGLLALGSSQERLGSNCIMAYWESGILCSLVRACPEVPRYLARRGTLNSRERIKVRGRGGEHDGTSRISESFP